MPRDSRPFLYRTNADDHPRSTPVARNSDGSVTELLRLLRRHSPLSRADLVRLSGLTAPTVSAGIAKLERRDLVVALGPGSSSGGRPPGLLQFNACHGYVIGVDIGGSRVCLALADLNGVVIGRWNAALRADRSPKAVTAMIGAAVRQLIQHQKIPTKKILELVAGAPGITDVTAGRVLSAPHLTAWRDVPLRDLLQEETRIPTSIENDVNLGALGEGWQGAALGTANFVFLAVGVGVGAGIVVNNILHHGANWSAGEIGYMMLPGLCSAPPAKNGLGALESAVGGKIIERTWANLCGSQGRERSLRATEIFDLGVKGDRKARNLLHQVAEQLAIAITNLSLVLDLSLVVLSGDVGIHEGLLQAVRHKLDKNEVARPQLVMSSLRGDAQILGAIWLGLQTARATGFRRRSIESGSTLMEPLLLAGNG